MLCVGKSENRNARRTDISSECGSHSHSSSRLPHVARASIRVLSISSVSRVLSSVSRVLSSVSRVLSRSGGSIGAGLRCLFGSMAFGRGLGHVPWCAHRGVERLNHRELLRRVRIAEERAGTV